MPRQFESVPYKFTREEIHQLGQDLARANQQIYDLRGEKVTAVASLGAAIKAAEKCAADLTTKINQKFEMRSVEVIAVMDRPKVGAKTIVRSDSGEELRTEAMTLEEQQASLDFGEGNA